MLPFLECDQKGDSMPKYFMGGTRYAAFERMMMSTDRRGRDEDYGFEDSEPCHPKQGDEKKEKSK